ncbi:hypothetical protein A2U01_0061774, partial [Trifolium medium]|nr:hypothetical protein [Trifolium medium]
VLRMLVDSFGRIHGKQDFPLELEVGLPVQVVAGVELFVVARYASFPYDAFQLASTVPDIAGASLVVVVTSGSTNFLQGQFP